MEKTKEGLLLVGGVLLGVAGLAAIFVPVTSVPTVDEEVLLAIGLVMVLIGAFIA